MEAWIGLKLPLQDWPGDRLQEMVVPDPHAVPNGATLNATVAANAWLVATQMVRAAMMVNFILDLELWW